MSLNLSDMVLTIINFLIMIAILYKFLYKPVLRVMDIRKQEIQQNYAQAETAKHEALKLKEDYTAEIQNARKEAQEIITKAKKLGEESQKDMMQAAKQEALQITKKAREEIILEKEKAKDELRDEVAALVVLASGRVIEKTIRMDDHEQMIRQFVQGVGDEL